MPTIAQKPAWERSGNGVEGNPHSTEYTLEEAETNFVYHLFSTER